MRIKGLPKPLYLGHKCNHGESEELEPESEQRIRIRYGSDHPPRIPGRICWYSFYKPDVVSSSCATEEAAIITLNSLYDGDFPSKLHSRGPQLQEPQLHPNMIIWL